MNLKDQVVSHELAKRLKELGVPQESLWWWIRHSMSSYGYGIELKFKDSINIMHHEDRVSAFTCAELEELLKNTANTGANARAKLLIYLLENNLIDKADL
jgi:hypothetical protein